MKKILGISVFIAVALLNISTSYSRGKMTRKFNHSAATTNVFINEITKKKLTCEDELMYCYDQTACEARDGQWHDEWAKTNPNNPDEEPETLREWVNPQGETIEGICFPKVDVVIEDDVEEGTECAAETPSLCSTKEECETVGFFWNDTMETKCQSKESFCSFDNRGTWDAETSTCNCPTIDNFKYTYSEEQYICIKGDELFYCSEFKSPIGTEISKQITRIEDIIDLKQQISATSSQANTKEKKAKAMKTTALISGTAAVGTTTWATVAVVQNVNLKKCLCKQSYRKKQYDRGEKGKRNRCAKLLPSAVVDENGAFTTLPIIGGEQIKDISEINAFCSQKSKYQDSGEE